MSFFNPQIPPLPDGDLRAMIRALEENQNARFAAFASFLARKEAALPTPEQPAAASEPFIPDVLWYALGLIMLGELVIIGLLTR